LQVRAGVALFDVSSLLQRMRLREGCNISAAALTRSIDKVNHGAFLYAVRQAGGRLFVGGSDGVVSLWG
jgi:isochorismate synthase EntC